MSEPLETATRAELFRLGQAWGSFSVGEIEQGVHCVLPVDIILDPRHPERSGTKENEIFRPLLENYFDKIRIHDFDPFAEGECTIDCVGDAFMGAIEKFAKDNNVDIECDSHIEAFERHLKK